MNKQKQTYLSPETETLVVQAEGVICYSIPVAAAMTSDWGTGNKAGGDLIEDAGFDL